ncbi:hypothetical protein [Xylanimonas ulmi]|uniref:Uncharacterized protein n=1 Tax=Xylanimonas ulmi TaxID=228973 RepID=A0A4Q7LZ67_9MICO|nr:hypothetical protein [Xylanibacterium ulmi]RZS60656.1 hypothetical protein EV386_0927 [Xylanibacterium ulmi]
MRDYDLVQHVADSLGTNTSEARRVIFDVVHYFAEPVDEYIRRRHLECRSRGMKNDAIYDLLKNEIQGRLFAAPQLSIRQIRRTIYG